MGAGLNLRDEVRTEISQTPRVSSTPVNNAGTLRYPSPTMLTGGFRDRHVRSPRLVRPAGTVRIWAVGFALLAATACVSTSRPWLLALPDPAIRPAANIHEIREYGVAAATVLAIFERDLGFKSFPVVFQFCPDAAAFEAALLDSGYDLALARDTARTMQAVGGYRRILLNEAMLAREPWASRIAMLAHELAHSIQYEWGGGQRGTSDQWLREGFAEWTSLQVLARLRVLPLPAARRRYIEMLRRGTPSRSRAPKLEEMVTFRQWVALGKRPNSTQYAQAFLSVDFLIDRQGLPAVVKYFQSFARSSDRGANFYAAFGEDLASFAAAAAQQLWPR
jgi:hypothetical protein